MWCPFGTSVPVFHMSIISTLTQWKKPSHLPCHPQAHCEIIGSYWIIFFFYIGCVISLVSLWKNLLTHSWPMPILKYSKCDGSFQIEPQKIIYIIYIYIFCIMYGIQIKRRKKSETHTQKVNITKHLNFPSYCWCVCVLSFYSCFQMFKVHLWNLLLMMEYTLIQNYP